MKKFMAILMCALLALSFAACKNGGDGGAASAITGSSSEVLSQVIENADYDNEMMLGDEALSAENCENTLGIPADVFEANVADGTLSYAMISSVAHLTAVVKCNDAASAAAVKEAITSGFNMQRWVCVMPEKAFAVDSGEYVFFAATFADYAEALYTSFASLAGDTVGERSEIGE